MFKGEQHQIFDTTADGQNMLEGIWIVDYQNPKVLNVFSIKSQSFTINVDCRESNFMFCEDNSLRITVSYRIRSILNEHQDFATVY
jgi:hypothetical protein